ncbi:MAG TPA: hypothetical protein VKW08_10860 [Xanthobacteraceae bacterium]|nr:hypothetical protein [Xanthobacteraceae bacterium]
MLYQPTGLKPVTDPATLAQFNAERGGTPVTDPEIMAQLNPPPLSTAITDMPCNVTATAVAGVKDIGSSFQHAPPAPGQSFTSYLLQAFPKLSATLAGSSRERWRRTGLSSFELSLLELIRILKVHEQRLAPEN